MSEDICAGHAQVTGGMQLASMHILDMFAAFALARSPGAAACLVSNAASDATRQQRPTLGRDSAILQQGPSPGGGCGGATRAACMHWLRIPLW